MNSKHLWIASNKYNPYTINILRPIAHLKIYLQNSTTQKKKKTWY